MTPKEIYHNASGGRTDPSEFTQPCEPHGQQSISLGKVIAIFLLIVLLLVSIPYLGSVVMP